MASEKLSMTRIELYERVWATPMRTLAKEFGISDVGLAEAIGHGGELETMVEWGLRHSNYLDPLTDLKGVAQQFKNPPRLFGY